MLNTKLEQLKTLVFKQLQVGQEISGDDIYAKLAETIPTKHFTHREFQNAMSELLNQNIVDKRAVPTNGENGKTQINYYTLRKGAKLPDLQDAKMPRVNDYVKENFPNLTEVKGRDLRLVLKKENREAIFDGSELSEGVKLSATDEYTSWIEHEGLLLKRINFQVGPDILFDSGFEFWASRKDTIIPLNQEDRNFIQAHRDRNFTEELLPSGIRVPDAPSYLYWKSITLGNEEAALRLFPLAL